MGLAQRLALEEAVVVRDPGAVELLLEGDELGAVDDDQLELELDVDVRVVRTHLRGPRVRRREVAAHPVVVVGDDEGGHAADERDDGEDGDDTVPAVAAAGRRVGLGGVTSVGSGRRCRRGGQGSL